MSEPTSSTKINLNLWDTDTVAEPLPMQVDLAWMPPPDAGTDAGMPVAEAIAGETAIVVEPDLGARQITVGVVPVWGVAVGWILAIVLASQALKSLLKAVGVKERLSRRAWRRWLYVIPVVQGTILAVLFGPALGELFGLRFGVWTSVLFLGPGSGAAAAFTYDAARGIILPVLPAAVLGLLERVTGLHLPESAKEIRLEVDTADSEAVVDD